jgi:exoribonuclease R
LDSVCVQFKREAINEANPNRHVVYVIGIELVPDKLVDVIVRKYEIHRSVVAHVIDEHGKSLDNLDLDDLTKHATLRCISYFLTITSTSLSGTSSMPMT